MDRGTAIFWGLVCVLFGASGFMGVQAEAQRRELQQASGAIASGDVVTFVSVVDGDTVVVRSASDEAVTIRILGIKSFDQDRKGEMGELGARAVGDLRRRLEGKPIRVELHEKPQDDHGRTLATLYVDDEDVGLALVREGTTLVYTAHPFPAMASYLQEQAVARGDRRGLWALPDAVRAADGLSREWGARAK